MPVRYLVDNERNLLVTRFFKSVIRQEVEAAIDDIGRQAARARRYMSLLIFEHSVDLSALDVTALAAIRDAQVQLFRTTGSERGKAAAVLDHSTDAHIVMPLHNALCEMAPESKPGFKLFYTISSALEYLELPAALETPILARTAPV